MNIYSIEPADFHGTTDVNTGHVIVANNEAEVMNLAAKNCADEGVAPWLSGNAKVLNIGRYTGDKGQPHIVLTSQNAG